MFRTRAFGHILAPSSEQIESYAHRRGLRCSQSDVQFLEAAVAQTLTAFDLLDDVDLPAAPSSPHLRRDPGRPPADGEDPFNAFTRFCRVEGSGRGVLAGRTVAVKDCIAVAGIPTTNGGRRQPYHVPLEDAVVVERILDAGAVVMGKTNLEDLALGFGEGSYFGAARNPLNPDYSTGGSSSGSAAAVASGAAELALGADEAGSIRVPAAWCGLVGMKATHGLVPSYGMTYMDHTIDHIGPITRNVADNALVLSVIAGYDERDPQWARGAPGPGRDYGEFLGRGVKGLRIGVIVDSLEAVGVIPEVEGPFRAAVALLKESGAEVLELTIPLWPYAFPIEIGVLYLGLRAMVDTYGQGYGHKGRVDETAVAATAAQIRTGSDDLPPFLKVALITTDHLRSSYSMLPLARAQNLRRELTAQVGQALESVDVLVTPTTPNLPFRLENSRIDAATLMERLASTNAAANTCPLDLTGHPALTVPTGRAGLDALPAALQIIGGHFAETTVYRVGSALEAALEVDLPRGKH